MGKINSDDHFIYYCGQESLRKNEIAIIANNRVWNAVLGCNLKNDIMISVHFQGKSFNITVIQVHATTSNAEEAEVEGFYEDLQDFLELTPPKKRCPFHQRGLDCKSTVQFSSAAQSCLTLCNPMNHSMPGLLVHHKLPESTKTHAHWVSHAIQPFHTLSSSSPPALNLSQLQGLFQWVSQSIGASASASVLPMNIQDWFPLWLTGLISLQSKRLSRVFSSTIVHKHQFFGTQPSSWPSSHIHTEKSAKCFHLKYLVFLN